MPEIETHVERQAEQAAYERWLTEARESGHNGEDEVFRAGWLAGRDYVSTENSG